VQALAGQGVRRAEAADATADDDDVGARGLRVLRVHGVVIRARAGGRGRRPDGCGYPDLAVQTEDRSYRVGPLLELAAHSQSATSRLRALALPHLEELVEVVDESANLMIRTGDTARFIASVECRQALRVGNREEWCSPRSGSPADWCCSRSSTASRSTRSSSRSGTSDGPTSART